MSPLSNEQVDTFHEQGYLLVEAVLSEQDLAPIIQEFKNAVDEKARLLFAQGKIKSLHEGADFESRLALIHQECEEVFYTHFGKSHHGPALWELMHHSKLLYIVESLVGPERYCHPTYNVRPKLPQQERTVVPWHQDSAYPTPDADATLIVSCWMPLVDATLQNGCMEVIVGSHRHGIIPHQNVYHYLDIEPEQLPLGERRLLPVRKGGLLLLHNMTIHRSLPNVADTIRWSVDLRYQDPSQPTGRDFVPGFLVRSKSRPDQVLQDREQWIQSLKDAGQYDDGRVKSNANPFAFRTTWGKHSVDAH